MINSTNWVHPRILSTFIIGLIALGGCSSEAERNKETAIEWFGNHRAELESLKNDLDESGLINIRRSPNRNTVISRPAAGADVEIESEIGAALRASLESAGIFMAYLTPSGSYNFDVLWPTQGSDAVQYAFMYGYGEMPESLFQCRRDMYGWNCGMCLESLGSYWWLDMRWSRVELSADDYDQCLSGFLKTYSKNPN